MAQVYIQKGGSYIEVNNTPDTPGGSSEYDRVLAGEEGGDRAYFAGGTTFDTLEEAQGATFSFEQNRNVNQPATPNTAATTSSGSVVKTVDEYLAMHPELKSRTGGADLVKVFTDEWTRSGSPELASEAMYGSPVLETAFPGITNEQGVPMYTITNYVAEERNYNIALAEEGLNPFLPLLQEAKADLFKNQVDSQEFAGRLRTIREQVLESGNKEQVLEVYNQFFTEQGTPVEMTDEALFLLAISPEAGQALLDRRFRMADIGVEAALSGFNISKGVALDLFEQGYGQQEASQLFGQASVAIRSAVLSQAQSQMTAPDELEGALTIEDYLSAFVDFDADAINTFSRIAGISQSMGSMATGAARTETGQVSGLIET